MLRLASLLALVALVSATVLPVRPERRIADADFIKRQKLVLELFIGVGHNQHYKNELPKWDINANIGNFADEKYPREFLAALNGGNFLPYDAIFSLACHHTMHDAIKLFDLFYFAKDFDTFYNAARWAMHNINPSMFAYTCALAVLHRPDTQDFILPPLYEIFPNYFVPSEVFHNILDYKLIGRKEGRFNVNNTGYEYNYHSSMFGGPLSKDNRGYGDFRVSYFTEDVGWNSWLANWFARNPSWMCPEKYGKVRFQRRGENFYYTLQQIFARYNLERLANGLPYTPIFEWNKPFQVGYNPRITYFNGMSFLSRPDNINPSIFNSRKVYKAEVFERRVFDAIDARAVWELANKSMIDMNEELLGRMVYGTTDRPSRTFYKSLYYAGIDALAYLGNTAADKSYVGNVLSHPATALRDPLFYSYIARIMLPYRHLKKSLGPYGKEDLLYPGVTIQNVEVDRFLTYFDRFDYEVTNGVPMEDFKGFIDHRYVARQFRLNHKPYRFNISVNSESAGEGIVRVFIGPKYDSDEHLLTIDQSSSMNFEIDRFPVKMTSGLNVWERNSAESPVFLNDQEGFSSLYTTLENAEDKKEQLYVYQGGRCGLPDRLQLPMGWKEGRTYILTVVVSSFDRSQADERFSDVACGGGRLYDGRALGFPFDRPIWNKEFQSIPNIFRKEVNIYHKDASDVNRASA